MLKENSSIFPKFDYYSSIWKNYTISEVLSFIHYEDKVEALENHKSLWLIAEAGCNWSTISFADKSIRLMIPTDDIIKHINPDDPVYDFDFTDNIVWTKIKLDISGKGLDALRSEGIDIDNIMRSMPDSKLNQQYYTTRCDIAYDFINYKPEFLDELVKFCKQHYGERLPICHKAGGTDFQMNCGTGETTVYLGSSRSVKRLRIYNKLQEQKYKECPYTDNIEEVKSWFRIELQLRRELSIEMLMQPYYNEEFFTNVLKYIYTEYSFRDVTQKGCVTYEWWENLWNWEEIPDLILNLQYTHYKTTKESIENTENVVIDKIIKLIAIYGLDMVIEHIKERIAYLNQNINDNNIEKLKIRNQKRKIIQAMIDLGPDNKYIDISTNIIKMKGVKER